MRISEPFEPAIKPTPIPRRRGAPKKLPSVGRDAALLLTSGAVIRLCGLVFMMVLSRRLSKEDVGVFSFYEALADTLTITASFSLDSVIIRRIAAAAPGKQTIAFAPLLAFRLISAPVYLLSITVLAHFVRGPHWLLPFVGFYTLMESASFSFAGFFIGVKRIGYKAAIEAGAELIYTTLFLICVIRFPSLKTVIVLSTIRSCLLLGAGMYLVSRCFGPLRLHFAPMEMIRAGAPFVLMSLVGVLGGSMETLLLGFLASLPATGAYQLALKLTVAAAFIPQAINSAFYPRIAAEGLTAGNRRRWTRAMSLLACLGGGAALFLLCFSRQVAQLLFGPMASEVAPVLRAIAPALLVRFIASGLTSAIVALNGEKRVFRGMVIGTLVGLTADCLLIPRYGAAGAAYGMLASATCQCVIAVAVIRSLLPNAREAKGWVEGLGPVPSCAP